MTVHSRYPVTEPRASLTLDHRLHPRFPAGMRFPPALEVRQVAGCYPPAVSDLARLPEGAVHVADGVAVALLAPNAGLTALDRKSTRLNSSHVRISYAVFCLK